MRNGRSPQPYDLLKLTAKSARTLEKILACSKSNEGLEYRKGTVIDIVYFTGADPARNPSGTTTNIDTRTVTNGSTQVVYTYSYNAADDIIKIVVS